MTVSPRGPKVYPLGALGTDKFEILVFLLARIEYPGVVSIRQKDHGLDARLPTPAGETLRGWQAKRFTGDINFAECQMSVRRALAFWRPLRITFAFPRVLSAKEQAQFKTKLIDEFRFVHLDWWDGEELQGRIRESDAGRRAATWAFEDHDEPIEAMRRAIAVGGELSGSAQAAARIAEVHRFVSGRDPHFHYTLISRDQEGPQQPLAVETVLSVEVRIEGTPIRFDVAERYPGAAAALNLRGTLGFTDDEAGRGSRAELEQALADQTPVNIDAGVEVELKLPPGLKGLIPEGPITGPMTILPGEPIPDEGPTAPGIPILVRCGPSELGLILTPGEPPDRWDVAAVGATGGLGVALLMLEGRETQLNWSWTAGQGTAREQLLAAQIMAAAYRGTQVEFVEPVSGQVVMKGTLDEPGDIEDVLRDVADVVEFLSLVTEVETWLGEPLRPPSRPTDQDIKVLAQLGGRIRKPIYGGTWTQIKVTLSKPLPLGGAGGWKFAYFEPLYVDLFGSRHFAGTEHSFIVEGMIRGATGEEGPGDTVEVVPRESPGKVEVRFLPPSELPEKAAHKEPSSVD